MRETRRAWRRGDDELVDLEELIAMAGDAVVVARAAFQQHDSEDTSRALWFAEQTYQLVKALRREDRLPDPTPLGALSYWR